MPGRDLSADPRWEEMRGLMPAAREWACFDHAAVAPISGPAQDAILAWLREAAEDGGAKGAEWSRRIEQIRATAAAVIGADPKEVAFVANTTAGINFVAEGFPWREGDNVVTLAGEFPSNLYPWMNLASRGVEERRVAVDDGAVDLARIDQACDARTRIIAASWVGYASGWRIDVDALVEMAHRRGILVFLDAIQGLGVFPLDVARTPVDFLAADGHKWLLGPEGAGIFYVRREHLDLLRPLNVGWNSVVHSHDFSLIRLDLRREAARYEGGSYNTAGIIGLGASLDMLVRFGLSSSLTIIADRVLDLAELVADSLRQIGADVFLPSNRRHRSGIVAFALPGREAKELRWRCRQAGVLLSARGGRLRASPHAYVNQHDVARLIEAVRDV